MTKFKAVIFDMDGLLIDSMLHWIELDKKFFAQHGLEFNPQIIRYLTGRSAQENADYLQKYLKEKVNLTISTEEIFTQRPGQFMEIYEKKCLIMPGVDSLLISLQQNGLQQAIASGAPLDCIETVVMRFKWQEYFSHLISADHVNKIGKPDPGIYLHVAKELNLEPKQCVVFEDAENGVVAAKRAGMNCVAVPDERWSFGDFSQADLVVNSLEDEKIVKFLNV